MKYFFINIEEHTGLYSSVEKAFEAIQDAFPGAICTIKEEWEDYIVFDILWSDTGITDTYWTETYEVDTPLIS